VIVPQQPSMNAAEARRAKLRRAGEETFDVLIVGGGINGAAIAREAALRGLSVLVVDKGDFASGTSSRSSKLIHGGFRYLETGDFGLVFEASRERDLLRRLAPHLVVPLRFFFPVYRGGPVGLWKLRVGFLLYDLLAAFRNIERHRMVRTDAARAAEPALRDEGLLGGVLYFDCFTDDARLVLDNVLAAEQAGATCLNYVAVEGFVKERGLLVGAELRDLDGEGGRIRARARLVVNAAGPWLDHVRALDDPAAAPVLRPTKGVHLVVPRERVGNRNAIVMQSVRDARVLFVIPWRDHVIIGTTDTDYRGSPDEVAAEMDDVEYLLETANHYFPNARLAERDVVSTFAGLRPLVAGAPSEAPSFVSREETVFVSASGLVSIGGGKLTTYRRIAVKVVDRVAETLRRRFGVEARRSSGTASLPLPGIDRGAELAEMAAAEPSLAAPLDAAEEAVKAEARFAASNELALHVEDVLRRRTRVALKSPDLGASAAEVTAELMAQPLGWTAATADARANEYLELVRSPETSRRQA
jgi:glycerol-3-phosphate dehydrogenase